MSQYEGLFIIEGKASDDDLGRVISQIEDEIKKNKGEITESKSLGKRQLAYAIKRNSEGFYILINFKLQGPSLQKIQEKLKLNQKVLRNLILKKS
ncbi:MAG: 30S ribosomal protein S6 [Candidatus Aureabacteria bacterium]|nr:30S ribosomal protein S6 [Candidatus Auribacterota bacterium]